jgi:hypothetical protein
MSDPYRVLGAFGGELEKLADMQMRLGNIGALGGAGAVVGAAGGAVAGGVGRYRKARREGGGIGGSLAAGVGGAASGAGKGALLGAGAGALAGAAAPKALYGQMAEMKGALGAASRFGQRQVHAATGWLPTAGDPKSIEKIRGGAYSARQTLEKAIAEKRAPEAVSRARGGLDAAEKAQQMGLTSVPGYAKSLRAKPLETVRAGMAEQWRSGGVGMKALTVGLPAVGAVSALRSAESPTGAGKGERVGRELAATAGGLLTAPLPFVPGQVVSSALGSAGGFIGRGVDRLRGRKPAGVVQHAVPPENVAGQHVPTERVTSPAATGQNEVMS